MRKCNEGKNPYSYENPFKGSRSHLNKINSPLESLSRRGSQSYFKLLWGGIYFTLVLLLASPSVQATTFCFCHNLNDMGVGNDICTSASAFDETGCDSNHCAHYLCYLCNNVCPEDPGFGDCALCETYPPGENCSTQDLRGKCSGCGNTILEPELGEQCEDGNNENGDGCSEDCMIECESDADCEDDNPCTDNICNQETYFCENPLNENECNDGDICTTGDQCWGGVCSGTVLDTDEDGTPDCEDMCPEDANKIDPGICGCGYVDLDSDGDGVADAPEGSGDIEGCNDNCPMDPQKTNPGICGCGVSDMDSDGDGVSDCNDACPEDGNKLEPGLCGCGVSDTDTDDDGLPDCQDNCFDVSNGDQIDSNGNGIGDACEAQEQEVIEPVRCIQGSGAAGSGVAGSCASGCSLNASAQGELGDWLLMAVFAGLLIGMVGLRREEKKADN